MYYPYTVPAVVDSDSDSNTYSDMYYPYTVSAVVDSVDSHSVLALLSSFPTDNP